MPIRIKGATDSRVGRISSGLGALAPSMRGTMVAPPGRAGRLLPSLGAIGTSFRGQSSVPASRNGRVSPTLGALAVGLRGTSSQEVAPAWNAKVINIDIPIRAGETRNLADYVSAADTFEIIATERTPTQSVLPSGVSMNSSGVISSDYSGSPAGAVIRVRAKRYASTEALQIADWWAYVTSRPSLINSQSFPDNASVRDISDTMSGNTARSQWDSSIKLFGNGCLRQDILDTDFYPNHPANWGARLQASGGSSAPAYGSGQGFTICCAIRVNRARVFDFQNSDGAKFYIISTAPLVLGGAGGGSSFQPYERVLQDIRNRGYWQGYYSDSFIAWEQSVTAAPGSGVSPDFKHQPAIDRGNNPLNGTDPATGSSWSAWQQSRGKYGGLYSWGVTGPSSVRPDPVTGAVIFGADQWTLIEDQILPGTVGGNNSYRRVRVAPLGQNWQTLYQSSTESLATFNGHGGFTGIQFTNSATNMQAQAGARGTPASQWIDALNIHAGLVDIPAIGFLS